MRRRAFLSLACLGFWLASSAQAADPLPLAIATMDYPHIRSIRDGKITIPECRISFSTLTYADLERGWENNSAGDVIEVGFAKYVERFSSEETHNWVLVPVFLWREFPQRYLKVESTQTVRDLAELAGKRVAVDSPSLTMAVWAKGILVSTTAATADYIRWDPSILTSTHTVKPVFENSRETEQAYFRQTRIFPIMTVLAVRKELVEANPWLPEALFLAFSDAKEEALEADVVPYPWGPENKEATLELMHQDYWSYGVRNNPKTLQAFFAYMKSQGLTSKELSAADLFAPETLQLIDSKGAKN